MYIAGIQLNTAYAIILTRVKPPVNLKWRKIMILKEIVHTKKQADWEKIPQEELWEDGELNAVEVQHKIIFHTMQEGDWILIRRIEQ